MENMNLQQILKHWGFEEYIEEFEDKNVTLEDLIAFSDDVKDIIPRNKLEQFEQLWKRDFDKNKSKKAEKKKAENSDNSTKDEQEKSAPKKKRISRCGIFITENFDIVKTLESSLKGERLLSYYKKHDHITKSMRRDLVDILISAIAFESPRDLENNDWDILSKKIKNLFPTEITTVYYIPPIPTCNSVTGKYVPARGKLPNRYSNLKKIPEDIRRPLPLQIEDLDASAEIEIENIDAIRDSIDWLKNNEEPWETTVHHWELSYKYRQSKKGNNLDNEKVSSVYNDWPILRTPKGFTLINIDFELSKLSEELNPIEKFVELFEKSIKRADLRSKDDYCQTLFELLENGGLNEDSQNFARLIIISYLLPSFARIPLGKRSFWKPSCLEAAEGIVCHVDAYTKIEELKEKRHAFAASKNITVQPYIAVVGTTQTKIESVYLFINDIEYKITNFKLALDLCFKSYHVLNAKYPVQSEHLMLFLQLGLYKFKTKWDKEFICVTELLNDIKILTE